MAVEFYEDKSCKKKIEKIIDFGVVEVGNKKEISFYIKNDGIYSIHEFKLIVDYKEITIHGTPPVLQPNKPVEITIVWKPLLSRKEALKTEISAQGYYIVR